MAELDRNAIEVDEYADLGMDEDAVECASPEIEESVFQTLKLKPISIRLPESLIEALKAIASLHGLGYQPLMRDALERFAVSEMKRLTVEYSNKVSTKVDAVPPETPELRHAA